MTPEAPSRAPASTPTRSTAQARPLGPLEREARACRRFGWTALAFWALFGLLLETAHGLKWASFLDDGIAHTLLRLAHAHGVILALGVLIYGVAGVPVHESDAAAAARSTGRLLRAGACLMPVGFAVSVLAHGEADPSPAIVMVPIGAAAVLIATGRMALRAWRR